MRNKNLALVATVLVVSVKPAFAMNPQDENNAGSPRVNRETGKKGALPLPINHYPEPPIVNRGGRLSLGLESRKAPTASSSPLPLNESPKESPKEPTASSSLPSSESPQPTKKRRSSKVLSHPRDTQGSPRSRKGSISSLSHQGSPRSRKNSSSSLSPRSDDEQKNDFPPTAARGRKASISLPYDQQSSSPSQNILDSRRKNSSLSISPRSEDEQRNDFPLTSRGRKPNISLAYEQQSGFHSQKTLDSPGLHRERKDSISPGDATPYRDPSPLRRSQSPSSSPEKTHKKKVDGERDSGPQRARLRSQSGSLSGKTSDPPFPQHTRNPEDALLRDLEVWNCMKTQLPETQGKTEEQNELKVRMTSLDHQELQHQYELRRPRDYLNNPNTELSAAPSPVKRDVAQETKLKGN